MDTGFIFRASWPIHDPNRTLLQLRVEASQHIDGIARGAGARIVGEISWSIRNDRLFAQVAAVPVTATQVADAAAGRAA